jgi:hypothetical protein
MDLVSLFIDHVVPCEVGPGCLPRDLPGARTSIVDVSPGAECPHIDAHAEPERRLVVRGELIEDGVLYAAGSYPAYTAGLRHRPRTTTGVRLFGFNLAFAGDAP